MRGTGLNWLWLILLLLTGCDDATGSGHESGPEKSWHGYSVAYPMRIVCTTAQVADVLRNVGGGHVDVEALMGPSVDPHQYKASLGDNRKLAAADAVFFNGLHLEGRMTDVLENMGERKPVFAIARAIVDQAPARLRKPPEFAGGFDPHIWFDVDLWSLTVGYVADKLAELDPQHAKAYRQNADDYAARLKTLDLESRDALSAIADDRRVLVTAHDAFGYFGNRYGIEVHGLQGISTADEADVAAKQKLVDLLVERKIKAVFVESSVPHQNVENLIDLCAHRGHKLVRGGELFSDAMGNEGKPEATYIGMVRYNVKTIVEALK